MAEKKSKFQLRALASPSALLHVLVSLAVQLDDIGGKQNSFCIKASRWTEMSFGLAESLYRRYAGLYLSDFNPAN